MADSVDQTEQLDPYHEMEKYLEKVAEELDQVFDRLSDERSARKQREHQIQQEPEQKQKQQEQRLDGKCATEWSADDDSETIARRIDDVLLELQLPEQRTTCQVCLQSATGRRRPHSFQNKEIGSGNNCGDDDLSVDNMRYRCLSSIKRKRSRSRSANQNGLQLPPGCYEDKSEAVLLKVKMFDSPPAPVRSTSLSRFQTIIAQQQKQFERQGDAGGGGALEAATQTSPACSRSSSFTWLSDQSSDTGNSSSADEEEEAVVSPCSSTDDSATDRHHHNHRRRRHVVSCGSSSTESSSITPPGRRSDEPESGIGTASPPPPHHRYSKPGSQKCRRKDAWGERSQRRHADRRTATKLHSESTVWVESGGDELRRPARPNLLPLLAAAECRRPEKIVYDQLPSPAAVSLNGGDSGGGSKLPSSSELTCNSSKSSSAPHLVEPRAPRTVPRTESDESEDWKRHRYQSEQYIAEIEAKEACKWLRAAGFPQYAQMYEDLQFPVDVNGVQKDHPFLDLDSLQSLYRRLHALNRCANMKLDFVPKRTADDSDSEGECALSENWTFQRESRRWSRVDDIVNTVLAQTPPADGQQPLPSPPSQGHRHEDRPQSCAAHGDGDGAVENRSSSPPQSEDPAPADAPDASTLQASRFRRSGSERLRDGAKAILRRVESLKTRRRKQRNRDGVVIGSPQIIDVASMRQRMKELNCVDVTPPDSPVTDDPVKSKRFLAKPESLDSLAYSDSELSWKNVYTDANSNNTKPLLEFSTFEGVNDFSSPNGSQDSHTYKNKDNDSSMGSLSSTIQDSDQELTLKSKGSVVRWHSFQKTKTRPPYYTWAGQTTIGSLTVGQLLVLRKLALLKLTAIMERYCPTHRTGWNWELPKFMRKTKILDPKDKTVFGVPLITNVQKYGSALPPFIRSAFQWLEDNALDHVGLFRKPGVKSRIQRLKLLAESDPDSVKFENHQAYDVADVVKQYFRELPEALLTNKLSESFIAIFQHVPASLQKEAVHCTVLLLPDEHREALFALLDFLARASSRCHVNQMSASNLAVCFAPSLFHLGHHNASAPSTHAANGSAGSAPSSPVTAATTPQRRNHNHHQSSPAVGLPDSKQLGQNKAAHDCLLFLIKQYTQLSAMSEDIMSQCHFSYMDESVPISLEELGAEMGYDWRGYLNVCTSALLKEVNNKNRGWMAAGCFENVDMWYKKVGDGHPLRLWRACTEVEAPPTEVLARVLWERRVWDDGLASARVVAKLDAQAELYQYTTGGGPDPAKDYCVVRSWRTDLNKGGCAVVETSVEHPDARPPRGAVRGVVLASRYLIEPCGSGRSRVLHLSRVDTKGRTCEWYNKIFGHIAAKYLSRIRKSFEHSAEGPESKV